jgi:hypothetical protein
MVFTDQDIVTCGFFLCEFEQITGIDVVGLIAVEVKFTRWHNLEHAFIGDCCSGDTISLSSVMEDVLSAEEMRSAHLVTTVYFSICA